MQIYGLLDGYGSNQAERTKVMTEPISVFGYTVVTQHDPKHQVWRASVYPDGSLPVRGYGQTKREAIVNALNKVQ